MTADEAFDTAVKMLWTQDNPVLTRPQIADRLKCGERKVMNAVTRLGLPLRRKGNSKICYQTVRRMLDRGMTAPEISEILNVAGSSIRRIRADYELEKQRKERLPDYAGWTKRELEEELMRIRWVKFLASEKVSLQAAGFLPAPDH